MFTNDSYALLIGVDDYTAFDASRKDQAGTSSLLGSTNDVRAFWRHCRRLGIKPANIRVLASPAPDLQDLEGATAKNVAPATQAEILEKAAWLADRLAQASHPTGLLTYSGHGDWDAAKGLLLCPTDVTAADGALVRAVSFHELNEVLAKHAENLTVVLDTCHSGPVGRREEGSRALSLTRRSLAQHPGLDKAGVHALEGLAGRVLCASRRSQAAFQASFDGQHRGVFSWALGTAIDQWRATPQGDSVCLDLTYDTLLETAERLISALWFDQSPQLQGPRDFEKLSVLQRAQAPRPPTVSARPDRDSKPEEIDPGYRDYLIYDVYNVSGALLAQVLVTATASPNGTYAANMEYWYITTNLTNGESVTFIGGTSQPWTSPPSLGTPSFALSAVPTWTASSYRGYLPNYQAASGGEIDGLIWQVVNTGGTWSGTITWWSNQGTGRIFGDGVTRALSEGHASISGYYFTQTL